MRWFQNTSIKTKVTLSISMAFLTVVIACTAFVWNDIGMMRAQHVRQTSALSATLGANSVTALIFDDESVAKEVLSSIELEPSINFARTYDEQGQVFASWGKTTDSPPRLQMPINDDGRVRRHADYLEVVKPIIHGQKQVGALLLRMDMTEYNGQLWQYAGIFALILTFSVAIIMMTASLLHRAISEPVIQLAKSMRQVSESGDYRYFVKKIADDELGELTDGFNDMLTQIEQRESEIRELNKQLIRTARTAGKAEVATNVLHNVGNVLNSVNVNASLLQEQTRNSRIKNLHNVVSLMNDHENELGHFFDNDERGKRLPDYLDRLADVLTTDQQKSTDLLDSLIGNIEKIKRIVQSQQSFAVLSSITETCSPHDVMDEAMQIVSISFQRHEIDVICEYEDSPPIEIDKSKLVHVLVNLISNAKDALKESNKSKKVLTLRTSMDGNNLVIFEVRDNAVGIEPGKLNEIFNYGYTTKPDGHGFGLHCSANDIKQMGGKLTAKSGGTGTGASFLIELELGPEAVLCN